MKKLIILSIVAVMAFGAPGSAGAQTSITNPTLWATMQSIVTQALNIVLAVNKLPGVEQGSASRILFLPDNMSRGAEGEQVAVLQIILAGDASVYPEALITGYYGSLTTRAVMRFQAKYGLPQVGVVGPLTRAQIATVLSTYPLAIEVTTFGARRTCAVLAPGFFVAPGWFKRGQAPVLPVCRFVTQGIAISTADISAPIISGIGIQSITSSSAIISWSTNEFATGKVYFGATSPINTATAASNAQIGYATTHTVPISNLPANSLQYFMIESRDILGNTSLSSQASFTTTMAQ